MKKHIQKKFLHETELTDEVVTLLEKPNAQIPLKGAKNFKIPKGASPFLRTDDNKFFKAFTYRVQNQYKLVPEPDPILIYFNAAYLNFIQVKEKKDAIFQKLSSENMTEEMIQELYNFFGVTSSFVVLLFTALEALINRSIKIGFIYKRENERKTELFSKQQIERYISFDEKIKTVLPKTTNKDFLKSHPILFTHISNLKDFRNMIVHTKEAENESTYEHLYKKALDFNYSATLDAVKDFCNFYTKPDFIVECNCSHDW